MLDFKACEGRIKDINGLLNTGQDGALFTLAAAVPKNGVIVEIGSYCGRSSACLAFGSAGQDAEIYCIDPFDGRAFTTGNPKNYGDIFVENMRRLGFLNKTVFQMKGESAAIGVQWKKPINLLFIDGDHSYDGAKKDVNLFFPHLVAGGILAMHDVTSHEGPTKVWDEIRPVLRDTKARGNMAWGVKI